MLSPNDKYYVPQYTQDSTTPGQIQRYAEEFEPMEGHEYHAMFKARTPNRYHVRLADQQMQADAQIHEDHQFKFTL